MLPPRKRAAMRASLLCDVLLASADFFVDNISIPSDSIATNVTSGDLFSCERCRTLSYNKAKNRQYMPHYTFEIFCDLCLLEVKNLNLY